MRTLVAAACLVSVAFVGYPSSTTAQPPTPPGKTICELPEYRGTAIYNKYCGGGATNAGGPQAPLPPDPNRTFIIERLAYQGEFLVLTSDGRRLAGQDAAHVGIDNGA